MNKHVKIVGVLLVVGVVAIVAARLLLPLFHEQEQRSTSDAVATKGTLRIGVDNWVGYVPLCSEAMVRAMRHSGYLYQCEEDAADYRDRLRRLQRGELQFAVATVDSYLLAGEPLGYPATIIAVIDESKGGDAIIARTERVSSLDAVRDGHGLRLAYTPDSPSAHLLKSVGSHFDIPLFTSGAGGTRITTSGSSDALARLLKNQADIAVLWEPDLSRALANRELVKLIGSEDTERLIVDILLVGRDFSRRDPEAVRTLLENYFEVQRAFAQEPQRLRDQVRSRTGLPLDQVNAMLSGVRWATLRDNGALWFNVAGGGPFAEEGLVDTIQSAVAILLEAGDFRSNPLPGGDPYRLTNRQFIADLYRNRGFDQAAASAGGGSSLERTFPPLDSASWGRLREVGSLRVEPIAFQSSTSSLSHDGKLELDRAVERLRHYPNFRLLVRGHTGVRGDLEANRQLSQERAEAVARYLMVTYGIDPNRIATIGYGGSRPLPQRPGESDRAWGYRLPRVELALMGEAF